MVLQIRKARLSMSAKVTVAIPAYNSERCLQETLESVLAQTVSPHEILVIDDGSTDRTEDIVRSFGDRIRFIKQSNQGIFGARNTAIKNATGEWIAFLDHDDIFLPTKLEKLIAVVDANPALVTAYSTFTYLYSDGTKKDMPVFPAKDLWPAIRYRTPILPSTALVRRSALLEIGGFRNFYNTDDWDLWFRLIRRYSASAFQEIPDSLTLYRWWEGNASHNFMPVAATVLGMLDTFLLDGLAGWQRAIWKRKIEAKIFYNLSLSLREIHNDRYWEYAIGSLLRWPFFGKIVTSHRYIVVVHMLLTRLRKPRFRLRYWWPSRRYREGLAKA